MQRMQPEYHHTHGIPEKMHQVPNVRTKPSCRQNSMAHSKGSIITRA
jgi:hypothetical protein